MSLQMDNEEHNASSVLQHDQWFHLLTNSSHSASMRDGQRSSAEEGKAERRTSLLTSLNPVARPLELIVLALYLVRQSDPYSFRKTTGVANTLHTSGPKMPRFRGNRLLGATTIGFEPRMFTVRLTFGQ